MSVVKVTRQFQVTIPRDVRRQIGLDIGDLLEASVQGGQVILTPKAVVDRSEIKNRIKDLFSRLPDSEKQEEEIIREADREILTHRSNKNR